MTPERMTPERIAELRKWTSTGFALTEELAECLDEIERLQSIDYQALDDAIRADARRDQMERDAINAMAVLATVPYIDAETMTRVGDKIRQAFEEQGK